MTQNPLPILCLSLWSEAYLASWSFPTLNSLAQLYLVIRCTSHSGSQFVALRELASKFLRSPVMACLLIGVSSSFTQRVLRWCTRCETLMLVMAGTYILCQTLPTL